MDLTLREAWHLQRHAPGHKTMFVEHTDPDPAHQIFNHILSGSFENFAVGHAG